MWRHEDIFFAALGGGGFGQPPIQTPEELASRVWPDDGRVTSLTLAPIMHGAAQWGMCIMLFGGGKVVLYTPHGFDPHEAWVLAERERAMTVMVVGDAMARPLGEALDQKSYDLSSVVSVVSSFRLSCSSLMTDSASNVGSFASLTARWPSRCRDC